MRSVSSARWKGFKARVEFRIHPSVQGDYPPLLCQGEMGHKSWHQELGNKTEREQGVEQGVRAAEANARVLKWHAEKIHGIEPGWTWPSVAWLPFFAALSINLGRKGTDGRTSYERRHGRQCRREFAEFTEKVLYLPDGDWSSRLEARWLDGLFLGPRVQSSDYFIGTKDGIVRAWSLRRLAVGERFPEELLPNEPQMAATEVARHLYIRRSRELQRYGFTPGCPGCERAASDGPPAPHTAECRARIVER
eukprot:4044018-Amphidinium_carterae.1